MAHKYAWKELRYRVEKLIVMIMCDSLDCSSWQFAGYFAIPVGRIMPLEVLNEHLVYAVRSRWVATGISHGAPTSIEILPHYHRNFPQSWIGSRGTGWYHAVVKEFVIQRVRPAGRSVLIDGHWRIVCEVCVPKHFEHIISSDLYKDRRCLRSDVS